MTDPDYIYDPNDWEFTCEWEERDQLVSTASLWPGEVKRVETLIRGPAKFAAHIVLTRDEDDCPDETEIQWFDSEEEAKAAATASSPSHT